MDMWTIILRSTFTFFFLLFLARMLGKSQLGQLTFFHYATGITIGSIAAYTSIDEKLPVSTGVISLVTWGSLTVLVSWLSLKFPLIRVAVNGEPTILIQKGKIIEKSLRKSRLSIDDLTMLLRKKDVFSTEYVDYAILEADGQLSVLQKPEYQTVAKKDTGTHTPSTSFVPTRIIADSVIIYENLQKLGLDESWVYSQLEKKGVSLEGVFYAELQGDGTLYIDKRDK